MATTPTYATGLLGGSSAYTPATIQRSEETTWKPEDRVVKPEELAQTQLQNITQANSPLMQQAATRGLQQAQQRGLLSSSLAAGAAQGEVLKAASPLAMSDAEAYRNAANLGYTTKAEAGQFMANQGAQMAAENAAAVNRAAELQMGQNFDLAKMGKQQEYDLARMGAEQGYKQQLMGQEQAYNLENLRTEYGLRDAQLKLQNQIASEQAKLSQGNELQKAYVNQVQQMTNNYMNGWFRIQESTMTPEQKAESLRQYNNTIRTWQTVTNSAFGSLPEWQNAWGMTLTTL